MSALFLFASLGVVNGILLSIYLFFKKNRSVADVYFAGLLLALCIRIGKSVLVYFNPELDRLILQIGLSACLFIGPFYYFYSKAIHTQETLFSRGNQRLLAVLLTGIVVTGVLLPYRQDPQAWNEFIIQAIYLVWVLFTALGLYQNREVFDKLFGARKALSDTDKKMLIISLAFVFITLTYQFALFVEGVTYIWGSLIFSASFYYLMARTLIDRKAPVPNTINLQPMENGAELMSRLEVLVSEQKPYLNPKLKLDELAVMADMSRHSLSRLLNEEYQLGFSHYIKAHRVKEAQILIKTRHELSLEGIGYEAGFNSKSAFFEAFKKLTGQTPAAFKKAILQPMEAVFTPD